MHWADEVRIETPEQIDVSLEVAGLGSRFVAQIVDWGIKFGVIIFLGLLAAVLLLLLGVTFEDKTMRSLLLAGFIIIFYVMFLGFDMFFEVRFNGQTPGKMVAGIRVIREGGGPVDVSAACVRNVLGLADMLPIFYLLGGLIVLLNKRGQRLGDMAAGTIVIRERAADAPVDSMALVSHLATDQIGFTTNQLAACAPIDRHILKSFFQRYGEMDAVPRDQLAYRLAHQFMRKTSYRPPAPIANGRHASALLASLYRDLESAARHER
jgi:uncharacterized RDD family membrane protein YckC